MELRQAIIRGKTIELEDDPGFPVGQRVEVVILPVPRERVPGEGILRSAGCLADDATFEVEMAEIQRERSMATYRESPE